MKRSAKQYEPLQTARCKLTTLHSDDTEYIVALYKNEEVRRLLGGPANEEAVRSSILAHVQAGSAQPYWVIRSEEDTFIGTVSLSTHHDGVRTEVSYQLLPAWWGQGYAAEAVQAVIHYAQAELGLAQVIAETQTANTASCRLLERLGMRLERTVERFGAEQAIYVVDTP